MDAAKKVLQTIADNFFIIDPHDEVPSTHVDQQMKVVELRKIYLKQDYRQSTLNFNTDMLDIYLESLLEFVGSKL